MLHLTIDDALDMVGFGKFQYLLLLLSAVGFFSTTIELILMALIKQPLQASWPTITNSSFAWLTALTFAGELLGGLIWGWIGDRLGRKLVFMGTAGMACLFGLLSAWSPCFHVFVACRFLLGIAIAFFYVAGVGFIWLPGSWKSFVLACGAPNVVLMLGRIAWRWESPRYLMVRGKVEEAKEALKQAARWNRRQLPDEFELQAIVEAVKPAVSIRENVMSISTISWLFFCQTFAYYGLTLWIRNFAVARGLIKLDARLMFLLIGLAELPGLALTSWLVEGAGRKAVLMINFLGATIASALLLLVRSEFSFLAIISVAYFFIVGNWAGIAFGVAGAAGKLGGFISPLIFGYLWDRQAPIVAIVLLVAGAFAMAALTASLLLLETRNKNLT